MKISSADLMLSVLRIGLMTTEEIASTVGVERDEADETLISLRIRGLVTSTSYGSTEFWGLSKSYLSRYDDIAPQFDNTGFHFKSPSLKEFRKFKKRVASIEKEDGSREEEKNIAWRDWLSEIDRLEGEYTMDANKQKAAKSKKKMK